MPEARGPHRSSSTIAGSARRVLIPVSASDRTCRDQTTSWSAVPQAERYFLVLACFSRFFSFLCFGVSLGLLLLLLFT